MIKTLQIIKDITLKLLLQLISFIATYKFNSQFHYKNEDGLTYLCLTESEYKISLARAFLKDLQQKFLNRYTNKKIENANAYGLKGFEKQIKESMEFYNSDEADKVKNAIKQLHEVKDIVIDNIDKILEREEKVDLLVQKTAHMNANASGLRK